MQAELVVCGEAGFLSKVLACGCMTPDDVRYFRSGEECRLGVAELARHAEADKGAGLEGLEGLPAAILISPKIVDVEPVNLVAALRKDEQERTRSTHGVSGSPAFPIYLFTQQGVSGSLASRAGLAGATRTAPLSELDLVLAGINASGGMQRHPACSMRSGQCQCLEQEIHRGQGAYPGQDILSRTAGNERTGAVIAVASGAGGVGKSTIALLAATSLARDGRSIALVDFDLQFGDLGYLLGLPDAHPLDEIVQLSGGIEPSHITPLATQLGSGVAFYAAPSRPECGDIVAPLAAQLLDALKRSYSFVVVNTGAFWTESHAAIARSSEAILLVMDQRIASIHACAQALELCGRLGVPRVRVACIVNRYSAKGAVSAEDAAFSLKGAAVHTIPDGGREVEELIGIGEPEELFDLQNRCAVGVTLLLDDVLASLGLSDGKPVARRSIPEARHIFPLRKTLARGR